MPVSTAAPSTVPVTIHPDAAARVDELGLRAEFERMLEYTLETVPNLSSVVVEFEPPCDPGDEPGVTIRVLRYGPDPSSNDVWRQWSRWLLDNHGPDVCRWFQMIPQPAG